MSLFGSLFKIAGGFLTGGPAGAIAAGTSVLLKGRGGARTGGGITAADSIVSTDVGPFSYHRRAIYGPRFGEEEPTNGGRAGPMGGTPIPGVMPTTATGCPAGYRFNKSTYVTRGGGTSHWPMTLQVHPKGTTCVRRRRRNVGNAKALRRAISRVKGFVKLARKAHQLVGGHRQKKLPPGRGQNIEIVRG